MKRTWMIVVLMLMGITTQAQLQNADFENWTLGSDSIYRPNNWVIGDGWGQFGIYKDTEAQNGDLAMKLSRWYFYTFDDAKQTTAINYKPLALQGHYKYTDTEVIFSGVTFQDSAHIYVYAKKWNSQLQQSDTIGQGHILLGASADWKTFNCLINYTSADMPDSIGIRISPTERNPDGMGLCVSSNENGTCSFLSVDNIVLSQTLTDVQNTNKQSFSLFPNPAVDKVYITTGNVTNVHYSLLDATGKLLSGPIRYQAGDAIDIAQVPQGIYLLVINSPSGISTQKIIKQ